VDNRQRDEAVTLSQEPPKGEPPGPIINRGNVATMEAE